MSSAVFRSFRLGKQLALVRRMAVAPTPEELGLKGVSYYFNAQTTSGRRNVVCAVYGSLFAIWFGLKMRGGKKDKSAVAK